MPKKIGKHGVFLYLLDRIVFFVLFFLERPLIKSGLRVNDNILTEEEKDSVMKNDSISLPTEPMTLEELRQTHEELMAMQELLLPQEDLFAPSSYVPPKETTQESRKKSPLMPPSPKLDPRCAETKDFTEEEVLAETKRLLDEKKKDANEKAISLKEASPTKPRQQSASEKDPLDAFSSTGRQDIKGLLLFGCLLIAAIFLAQSVLLVMLVLMGR
jgi:hypothetical protein